ncbi:ABC transporter permease [Solirubrobacter phytolaccae]|uniref:ABC transporter permease n=1 Tax=Solirubrobacter phytolaccae TaxID=1404360 RepID=A0A9X3SA62_9ACTN|nr:ABC transporter permease [Solirubrobacter phytolaccae]MDA0179960.1 ABC transporter permease [Solirubrobacter phytolaccae]
MFQFLARRSVALVLTALLALAAGHVLFNANTGVKSMGWGAAIADTPAHMVDLVTGELGDTTGEGCNPGRKRKPDYIELCTGWGAGSVAAMMRDRVPVDLQLIIGGMLLGTLLGIAAGRWCAAHPGTWLTRALHVAMAFLLSCPPYFLAFVVLVYFSWSSGEYKLPFVSGQGDYRPFSDDPMAFLKAMWVPWVCCALPLAAVVARIAEASMRDALGEDFIRTAQAKGVPTRRVINHHALPVALPPITAMTGVNISTMLISVAAIEFGFGIPGMFLTIRGAIYSRDVPVLEALVLEAVVLVVVANFLVDAYQAHLDPRVRDGGSGF